MPARPMISWNTTTIRRRRAQESDTFLVQQAAQELTANINTIKSELTTAGEPEHAHLRGRDRGAL